MLSQVPAESMQRRLTGFHKPIRIGSAGKPGASLLTTGQGSRRVSKSTSAVEPGPRPLS